jgi:hypothetical protein
LTVSELSGEKLLIAMREKSAKDKRHLFAAAFQAVDWFSKCPTDVHPLLVI